MRHNNRGKASNIIENFDRVYIDVPQCPWLRSITVMPLKTRYYNRASEAGANIDYVCYEIEQFENMLIKHGVET